MEEKEFWSLLILLDWNESGDDDAVIEPTIKSLGKKDIKEIYSFEEILSKKLFALDTKQHAMEIGEDAYIDENEFFSVDGFLYSRCVVVANGEELFNDVLKNPKEFPKDMEFEAILSIAQEAYEEKTGEEWKYVTETDYETYSNKAGWQ